MCGQSKRVKEGNPKWDSVISHGRHFKGARGKQQQVQCQLLQGRWPCKDNQSFQQDMWSGSNCPFLHPHLLESVVHG